jgi:hypothetical protein
MDTRTLGHTGRYLKLFSALLLALGTLGLAASSSAASTRAHLHPQAKKPVVLHGHTCTVLATTRHPRATGRAGAVVCGISGNDTLTAVGPGMVFLIAGPLAKATRSHVPSARAAAPGNDTLIASNDPGAEDVLIGGSGNDTFETGSEGHYVVVTGSGTDTIDCTSTAEITISGDTQGDQENDCQGQNVEDTTTQWEGTIASLPDATHMDVNWTEQEGADAWRAANGNPNPVNFDISNATNENNDHCPLAVGDGVEVSADLPSSGTTLIAVTIDSEQGHSNCQGDSDVAGTVDSVNGNTSAGACGTAGATGTFTMKDEEGATVTVAVTSSTTFEDPADPTPSFADVCVGAQVHAAGTLSSGTLTASIVSVQSSGNGGSGNGQ